MRRLVLALVAVVAVAAWWPGPAGMTCTGGVGGPSVDRVVDSADPSYGSMAVGIVEYETVASAPYLGVAGARSMSALTRSWGDPSSPSLRIDARWPRCGEVQNPIGHRSLFAAFDGGDTVPMRGLGGGISDSTLAAFESRFGPATSHNVGIGLQAATFGRLWILPLSVPAVVIAFAALADRQIRRRMRKMRRAPAVVSVGAGLVLGVALSLPDPGWSSVRLVVGFWALSFLAMLVARFGSVSAIALVAGTALYGIGAAPFTGRRGAEEVAALGVALLVVGASIQATSPTKPALRAGHVAVMAGAAMVSGSIWVRGSFGGGNGPIFFAGVFAAVVAAVWAWYVERSDLSPGAPPLAAGTQ